MANQRLAPAVFVNLESMTPNSHGHNLIVRVLEKKVVVDRTNPNGGSLRIEECLIADKTGCMLLSAKNEQCDQLDVGHTVALRNCKVVMHKKCMRLAIDKWGAIKPTTEVISADSVNIDKRMSEIEYEQVNS